MRDTSNLRHALESWRAALGPDRVCDDAVTLDRYARSAYGTGTRAGAVLYPTSTAEVQRICAAATEHGAVLYPISRGKNWGYGDACPTTPGAAIVDLSRMNRVVEVNATLGYAVIEPGVTQAELYAGPT